MSGIKDYSTTPANNNAAPPNGFPEGMAPASLNDGMRQVMADIRSWYQDPAWIDFGDTPTYSSGTVFLIAGNVTTRYPIGMRIRASGTTPFTIYGTITNSTFSSPNTTVTVSWDSGSMDSTLNAVAINMVQDSIEKLSLDSATITTLTSTTANITTVNATNLAIAGTSSSAASITLAEDTDNGTNKATLIAPTSIASDYTVTLPSSAGTLATTSDVVALFNGCKLYQTTGTSIPSVTWTEVLFDTEAWDDDGWHSTSSNTGRITANFTGRLSVYGGYDSNSNSVRTVGLRFKKNGTVFWGINERRSDDTSFENVRIGTYAEIDVVPTDYITMEVYQSTGGNVTTGTTLSGTQFSARRIK